MKEHAHFTDLIITYMEASQEILEATKKSSHISVFVLTLFVLPWITVVFNVRCAFKVSGGNVFLF